MRFLRVLLTSLVALVATVTAKKCNHDNCYRAIARYQRATSTGFCNSFLATPYVCLARDIGLTDSHE